MTEDKTPEIRVEKRDRTAILVIDNPKRRNAIARKLRQELNLLVKEMMADDDVGAIVLTVPASISAPAPIFRKCANARSRNIGNCTSNRRRPSG